jgi:hypothetical protein
MEDILIIAIILFTFLWFMKPEFKAKVKSINSEISHKISNSEIARNFNSKVEEVKEYVNNYEPTQEDIQEQTYVDKTKSITDFPYPQISRAVKKLSEGKSPLPLNNDSKFKPNGERDLKFIRRKDTPSNMTKERMYLPDFYRKDRLSGNPSGTEELRKFELNNDKSEQSWTDENVSEHPKFYNADIKNELTNVGSFFDKNNQYNGKTSVKSESLTADRCYKDKNGNKFCEDNTRLQLIPPSLINDPQNCYALNSVGMYKDMQMTEAKDDRVINGGLFFNGISASKKNNETYSRPISQQVGSCAF